MGSLPTAHMGSQPGRGVAPLAGVSEELEDMADSGSSGRFGRSGRFRRPLPPKLYRIGEVVSYCGLSRQTVHNYTTMGLLREARWTDGGHRQYDESVFVRIDEVEEMKAQGKSLREIRKHFARMDAEDGRNG